VELTVDQGHLGPSREAWEARLSHERLGPVSLRDVRRLVVVAPHPDDEVLGAGGLIQRALSEGVSVTIVAVTDGEASHPHSNIARSMDLGNVRRRESQKALRRLGWDRPAVTYLGLPDSDVAGHRRELDDALESLLLPGDLCVGPWRYDGHPDHDLCGESVVRATRHVGAHSLGYLVWAWHWAEPEGTDIPFDRCVRLDMGRRTRYRKRWSTQAFRSQIKQLGPDVNEQAVLPRAIMRRFWGPFEIFVVDMGAA